MIGRLDGILVEKQPAWVILDVHGVGYEVELPLSVFASLPSTGEPLTLWTHHVVREDAQLLYGFFKLSDRRLFRELIRVSGVGPKMALAILSGMVSSQLLQVLQDGDVKSLTRIPGVGKKTAERLLVELRDRLADWQPQQVAQLAAEPGQSTELLPAHDPHGEAEAALIALGYKPTEASRAISQVEESGMDTQALIRAALKQMATR
ncbi:Holliday junction DNA helicase RuvA [Terasakiispira papahanaumokuakeensis]|uniref:Holliday junction branch migration complex subunit RuvA n=1 Tax=Terasakiispira papahanaumokuakeensis TaxID=197479 RepID=A0A1E2V8X9_9GAMM|nr:Holliday junction branch migration protein RuvA [Terasakiispira papahanaumokuakeensis]ODC03434.1 Holliday junction DNA helicase RuvA [Terasakiispira papahanaumokuakeensis]